MSMTDPELKVFYDRVQAADRKGYLIADAAFRAAELAEEAGLKGYGSSTKDLMTLCEAVLAKRAGNPVVAQNKAAPVRKKPEKAEAKPAAKPAAKPEPKKVVAPKSAPKKAAKKAAPKSKKAVDYKEWTSDELYNEAQARDLKGRSALSKAELIKALQKDDKSS